MSADRPTFVRRFAAVLLSFSVLAASEAGAQQPERESARRRIGEMLSPDAPLGAALVEQARDIAQDAGLPPWRADPVPSKSVLPFERGADDSWGLPGWRLLGGMADPIRFVPPGAPPASIPVPSAKPAPAVAQTPARSTRRSEARSTKAEKARAARREARRNRKARRAGKPAGTVAARAAKPAPAAKEKPNLIERIFGPPVVRDRVVPSE